MTPEHTTHIEAAETIRALRAQVESLTVERDALAGSDARLREVVGNLESAVTHWRDEWSDVCNENQVLINTLDESLVDVRRYQWLKSRLLCADFRYGPQDEACCALVFEIPDDMQVSANLDASIDAAIKAAS